MLMKFTIGEVQTVKKLKIKEERKILLTKKSSFKKKTLCLKKLLARNSIITNLKKKIDCPGQVRSYESYFKV